VCWGLTKGYLDKRNHGSKKFLSLSFGGPNYKQETYLELFIKSLALLSKFIKKKGKCKMI